MRNEELIGPVLVVGFGVSGKAALRLLLDVAEDARLRVNDARPREAFDAELLAHFEGQGVRFFFGGHDPAAFEDVRTIVLSPGIPRLEQVQNAQSRGVRVIGEIELALRYVHGEVVAVTGTNGKSTVVSLVGAMAEAAGRPYFVGGNLGTALSDGVRSMQPERDALFILELSSFQLETVEHLGASVACLLNITEDHAERYADFASYAAAKARIFRGAGRAVVPAGDAFVARQVPEALSVHGFGEDGEVFLDDGVLVDDESGLRVARKELTLVGAHNGENACAAMLIARLAGLSELAIAEGLRTFEGLPHRMARVAEVDGVLFIDDSKATNVGAALASIRSLEGRPYVLIAGGRDKDGDLSEFAQAAKDARSVVLVGEASERFAAALSNAPLEADRLHLATDFEDAVRAAAERAQSGDAVLLAPACSSYDMFRSYVQRGEAFAAAVFAIARERREERAQ